MENKQVRVTIGSTQDPSRSILKDRETFVPLTQTNKRPKANLGRPEEKRCSIQQQIVNPVTNHLDRKESFLDFAKKYPFRKVFQVDELKKSRVVPWGLTRTPLFQKRTHSKSNAWVHLLISIAAAILVGSVMGFSILTLFFSDNPVLSSRSIDSHLVTSKGRGIVQPLSANSSQFSLPSLQMIFLQGGLFSDYKRATDKLREYQKKGIPVVMTEQAPYRLYLGMSSSRDDALKLSVIYQKKDIPVYLKEVNLSGNTHFSSEHNKVLKRMIQNGHSIVMYIGNISTKHMQFKGVSLSSVSFSNAVMQQIGQFNADADQLVALAPNKASRVAIEKMKRSVEKSVQATLSLINRPSQDMLWKIQEQLMEYPLAYEKLLYSFNKK